jgi:hypothetical protein
MHTPARRSSTQNRSSYLPLLLSLWSLLLLTACSGISATPSRSAGLIAAPVSVDFGAVNTKSPPSSYVLTMSNTESFSIKIESASITPTGTFSIQGATWPIVLDPAQTVQLNVLFTPKTESTYAATLVMAADVVGLPQPVPSPPKWQQSVTVPLSGSAVTGGKGSTITVSISPSSASMQSGQTLQFTAKVTGTTNTEVTWTAALGSISSSGLYTSPNVTTQTVDTVSAISVADPTKYASSIVTVQAGGNNGPYSLTDQQPITPVAYSSNPASITAKRLPADVLDHLWGNVSSVTASNGYGKCITTDCGAANNSGTGSSWGSTSWSSYGNYGTSAIYWASPGDPWYSASGCWGCPAGWLAVFQAPNNALWPGGNYTGDGDNHFTAIGTDMSVVMLYGAPNFKESTGIGACPGGGHAGTQADPCPIPTFFSYASQEPSYYTSRDWQSTNSQGKPNGTSSLGFAPLAGMDRTNEILSGVIPHAEYDSTDCVSAPNGTKLPAVFPGTGMPGTLACGTGSAGPQYDTRPQEGMLFFADYSDAQLDCLDPAQPACTYTDGTTIPKVQPFQMIFLTRLAHYGSYIGETGAGGSTLKPYAGLLDDVATNWTFQDPGNPLGSPFWAWANSVQATSGSNYVSCYGPRQGTNPSQQTCSMYTYANVPAMIGLNGATDQTGNSCTAGHGCDLSGHIQVADPCVAVALAGLPSSGGVNACP